MKKSRGKPRKFETAEDFENKAVEYIEYCRSVDRFPNTAGFCVYCDMAEDTFYAQKEYYSEAYQKVQKLFEDEVLNNKTISDTMRIFYMKNKCGYYDRVQQDVKVSGSIEEIFSEKQIDF